MYFHSAHGTLYIWVTVYNWNIDDHKRPWTLNIHNIASWQARQWLQYPYPRPDDVECGALAVGFMFPDQELPPDEPDPEAFCVVCFEWAVGCETAEIGECKLLDDDDDDDDRACAPPWLLDCVLVDALCDEMGTDCEGRLADTLWEDVGVSPWLDDGCWEWVKVQFRWWLQVKISSMQQWRTLTHCQ